MSSCTTIYGADQTITNYYTNTITSIITSSGSAYTTSTPIVASSCITPTCSGNSTSCGDPVCSTSTSYEAQTITGGAQTITSYVTSVGSYLSTSAGGVSTSCTVTSDSSSSSAPSSTSPSSSSSQYTPPTTSSATPTTSQATTAIAAATSSDAPLTSTSFSTVFVTSIGSNGHTSVIAVPTLLNSGSTSTSSHKSNAGAIGGGVVGGVVALLAAVGFLFYLKRKGVFSKDGNEFGDDMWRPSAHSPDGGDHPEYAGERGSGDGSSGLMAEKESGSLGHMGRQSFYGAPELGAGAGAGQGMHERAMSPVGVDGYVDATSADGHQLPAAAYRESRISDYGVDMGAASGYAAGAGAQRLSHRQSLQSGSGHGSHDNHTALMPDPRLSGHYLYQPGMYEAGYAGAVPVEHLLNRANSGSVASDHSDSRTAATTGSTVQHPSMPMPSSKRLMANLNESAPAMPRPTLQSTSGSGGSLGTNGSGGDSSLFSSITSPSTAASSVSAGQKSPSEAPRQVSELKGRPGINRHDSVDSLLVPSQFLGARITNATPAEEKAQYDWAKTKA